MKKLIIANLPEQAAIEFAEENKSNEVDFKVIPRSIGTNETFWAKLCEIDPMYICKVPQEILNREKFSKLVDHLKFYRFIPKKYLTEEDYLAFKENKEKALSAYGAKAEISNHNEFVWYKFPNSNWYRAYDLTDYTILNQIDERTPVSCILPELWSQNLADIFWNSALALKAINVIPDEYVRDEWKELIKLYKEYRYPLFGSFSTLSHPELLAEYWMHFKDAKDFEVAFEVEELCQRCSNPYGYAVSISFNEQAEEDFSAEFEKMWSVIKDRVDSQLAKKFFDLYGRNFLSVISDDVFKLEWITSSYKFKKIHDEYMSACEEVEMAESDVERLEAQDDVDTYYQLLKDILLSYRTEMSNDEVEAIISSLG